MRSVSDGNRKQHFRDSRLFTSFHKGITNNIVYIHSDRWNKLTKNLLYYTVRKNVVVIQTGCPHYTTKIPYLQYIIPNLKYLIAKFSTCSFYSLNKTRRTEHTALQVCLILKYHKDYGGEKLLNKVRK